MKRPSTRILRRGNAGKYQSNQKETHGITKDSFTTESHVRQALPPALPGF